MAPIHVRNGGVTTVVLLDGASVNVALTDEGGAVRVTAQTPRRASGAKKYDYAGTVNFAGALCLRVFCSMEAK